MYMYVLRIGVISVVPGLDVLVAYISAVYSVTRAFSDSGRAQVCVCGPHLAKHQVSFTKAIVCTHLVWLVINDKCS